MSSLAAPPRPAGASGRLLALLGVLVVGLGAAFVLAPRVLASRGPGEGFAGQGELTTALREAFVGYWGSGSQDLSPGLEGVVDYWFRYHLAKATIAAVLLAALVVLGIHLWRAFLKAGDRDTGSGRASGPGRRAALGSGGALVTLLALFASVLVMANVQGAVAPFASLLPMLAVGATDAATTGALDEARQRLADSLATGGATPPALDVMVDDFARYHVAMAVIAAIAAAVFLGLGVVFWRRFAKTDRAERRTRRVWTSFGVLSAVSAAAALVIVVANAGTAADPAPALLAFFDGGW